MVYVIVSLLGCTQSSPHTEPSPTSGSLNILTYNVHGLPPAITNDDTTARIEQIAPMLQNFDIVGIQEDWIDENHQILVDNSQFEFFDRFDEKKGDDKAYGAGLTWLSSQQLTNIKHIFFDNCNGIVDSASDCLASKGIQQASISVGDTTLTILNTHLEAGNTQTDQIIREEQIGQILTTDTTAPAILLGDFNLYPDNEADLSILNKLETTGGYENICWIIDCPEQYHIDQIWIRSSESIQLNAIGWTRQTDFTDANGNNLSDHPPISAKIEWRILE